MLAVARADQARVVRATARASRGCAVSFALCLSCLRVFRGIERGEGLRLFSLCAHAADTGQQWVGVCNMFPTTGVDFCANVERAWTCFAKTKLARERSTLPLTTQERRRPVLESPSSPDPGPFKSNPLQSGRHCTRSNTFITMRG